MRISGFLIGGIVGAWAAMYFARNKPMMLANVNWDKAVDKAGQAVRSAKSMWDAAGVISASGAGSAAKTGAAQKPEADMRSVEQIVSQDPKLGRQVNEIMKESGTTLQ